MIKEKNFIILFLGRLLANFADSLYAIATSLLIYKLTKSTFYSGFALFLTSSTGVVQILFSPVIDKINIKKFLILSQVGQSVLLLIIPFLHSINKLSVISILVIMPIITMLNQFIYPSQLSLLPRILTEKELLKGNTLFTIAYQGSDAIFNALAGLMIALLGSYTVYYVSSGFFVINSIIFIFLNQKISKINSPRDTYETEQRNGFFRYIGDLNESFKSIQHSFLFSILIGFILINLLTASIYANLPAFSNSDILYSLYMASSGAGILLGSFILNLSFFKKIAIKKIYSLSAITIGAFWLLTILISNLTKGTMFFSVVFFLVGWIPIGIVNILSQTVVQKVIPKEKTGTVLGTIIGLSTCLSPIGALLGGIGGSLFTPSLSMIISSFSICLIGCYWGWGKRLKDLTNINTL